MRRARAKQTHKRPDRLPALLGSQVPRLPGFANGWTLHLEDGTTLKHVKRGARRDTGTIPPCPEWSGETAAERVRRPN